MGKTINLASTGLITRLAILVRDALPEGTKFFVRAMPAKEAFIIANVVERQNHELDLFRTHATKAVKAKVAKAMEEFDVAKEAEAAEYKANRKSNTSTSTNTNSTSIPCAKCNTEHASIQEARAAHA